MALDEKVCIVTGSGGGIGRATAIEMAAQGATVMVTDVNDEGGAETVATIEAAGGTAAYQRCDVRQEADIAALVQATVDRFGAIDVLHNNAGIHDTDVTTDTAVDTISMDAWTMVYEVNLRGVWLATKHAAPHLRASTRNPSVINAASIGGLVAYPMAPAYCSTKGAILQLTKATAVDLAPVRCNCYSPGSIDTPMVAKYIEAADDKEAILRTLTSTHLVRRMGEAEEVAKLVCFLASDDARFITGSSFDIDGGSMAWRGTH